jgi:hypothetical protein
LEENFLSGADDLRCANKMVQTKEVNIHVVIGGPKSKSTFLAPKSAGARSQLGFANDATLQNTVVAVGPYMDVTLRSSEAGAFTIAPIGNQVKSIADDGHAEWDWTVKPLSTGQKHLLLHTQAFRILPDGTKLPPEDLGTETATVGVTVLPWEQRFGSTSVKLLIDNWKAIIEFLVPGGGGAIWLAAWWSKRKETNKRQRVRGALNKFRNTK